MKHIIIPNSDKDRIGNTWGLGSEDLVLIRVGDDKKFAPYLCTEDDPSPWSCNVVVVYPNTIGNDLATAWGTRCLEIGQYVVWHHFGGTNSENVKRTDISARWAEWKACLDSRSLRKEGEEPCFFPFSMDTGCRRPWDNACQQLSAVVRHEPFDSHALTQAFALLDEAVAPAIRYFLGRPAEVLDQVFPVMLAIRGGVGIEEAKQFLPYDDEAKAKLSKSLQRWRRKEYWEGIKFEGPDEEGSQWIMDAAEFAAAFSGLMETGGTKARIEPKTMWNRFVSVSRLIREDERPG